MATYNFKKQAEVYIVYNNTTTRLDVTEDVSFSQTFTDKTYPQRTLHEPHKLHEASNIKKANFASFEFTIPALTQNTLDVIFNLLVDFKSDTYTLNTFDLYIKLPNDVYKLEKCVITNGTFIIEKLQNLKLGIQGQASKLTNNSSLTVPSINPSRGARTEQRIDYLFTSVDSTPLTHGVYKVAIELQNDVKWTPYETVNDALLVTNAATSMYPSNFTLEKRILSGSIGQYVTSDFNSDVQTWSTAVPIVIKAGESATQGFQLNLEDCSFTNRNGVEDVFTQTYDWKMNDNPTDLGSKLKFNNI
jgi:hypothetical protein